MFGAAAMMNPLKELCRREDAEDIFMRMAEKKESNLKGAGR
jgi:hypothetical protein